VDNGHVRPGVSRLVIISLVFLTVGLAAASVVLAQNDVLAKALRLDNQGHQDEAIALYRDVLARDPKSFGAHYGIARALDLRDRDLADLRCAHAQARIAIRRGDRAAAQRYTAAVKSLVDKGTNPDQRVQYPYLAGYVAFYSKDYKKALAELPQADQQDPFILVLIAEAYEHIGAAAQAREYYPKVLGSSSHAVNNAFARPVAREKLTTR
jgi:tetratricopeptide (TPR) repeat protein